MRMAGPELPELPELSEELTLEVGPDWTAVLALGLSIAALIVATVALLVLPLR